MHHLHATCCCLQRRRYVCSHPCVSHRCSVPDTHARSYPAWPPLLLLSPACRHWANLEYGCSAALSQVSLPHWNQDEEWGGFGGPHAMVVGGFDAALRGLAAQLGDKLRLSCPVSSINYAAAEQGDEGADGAAQQQQQQVKVVLASGEELEAALVLVTVPLGVLQQGGLEFTPALPDWKAAATKKLGFGNLNKVVMQVMDAGRHRDRPTYCGQHTHVECRCFEVEQCCG